MKSSLGLNSPRVLNCQHPSLWVDERTRVADARFLGLVLTTGLDQLVDLELPSSIEQELDAEENTQPLNFLLGEHLIASDLCQGWLMWWGFLES